MCGCILENAETKKGKKKRYTNQKANSAANLFAIHFSHFHAVPKTESNESQKEWLILSQQSTAQKTEIFGLASWLKWCNPKAFGWTVDPGV